MPSGVYKRTKGKKYGRYIDGRCNNIKEYKKKYRQEHIEKIKERDRKYRQEHKEEKKISDKKYRLEHKEERKKWQRKYMRERSREDCKFRFDKNIRTAICFALKNKKAGRHWEDLVGYTLQDLMKHLESLFEPWMNWNNWGKIKKGEKRWNIDHIKPQSLFKYKNSEDKEFKLCWALNNLQPLEAVENIKKSNHYEN